MCVELQRGSIGSLPPCVCSTSLLCVLNSRPLMLNVTMVPVDTPDMGPSPLVRSMLSDC